MPTDVYDDREFRDFLPLGALPRPVDGAELAARIRASIITLHGQAKGSSPAELHELQKVVLAVEYSGANTVESFSMDASGVVLESPSNDELDGYDANSSSLSGVQSSSNRANNQADTRESEAPAMPVEPCVTEHGTITEFTLRADPIVVTGVPYRVNATVHNVPLTWMEDAARTLWVRVNEPSEENPLRAKATLSIRPEEVVTALRAILVADLYDKGVRIRDLTLSVETPNGRTIEAEAHVSLRWKIISASLTARATAWIDDDLVLHVSDPKVSSSNPLIAIVLRAVRAKIASLAAQPIAIQDQLPPGFVLKDVQLASGEDFTVRAEFG